MSKNVTGNIKSLPPSEIRRVEKLFNRKLHPSELISSEMGREIAEIATKLRRRVGVLISREGRVEEVFLGTKDILYLPDLGRYRLGKGRLRRLRLIFSDLSNAPSPTIPADIFGDLEVIRLDAVCALKVTKHGISALWAHLVPEKEGESPTAVEEVRDIGRIDLDFRQFIESLEGELQESGASAPVKNAAVLVGVYGKGGIHSEDSLAELSELARTAGLKVADKFIQKRDPDPKTLLGKGKLEEVVLRCLRIGAEMLVFDCELKPSQWRAITNSTELKVIDRSMLILDIFAGRAATSEGRLQVELAQLKYNLPRLVEKDAGLSRLTGGIGGRGPGETKLEIGRRRIRERITVLETRIREIGKQRALRRERRQESNIPLVSIVGYTNVGKSTLFNLITKSNVLSENKLFATLDTTQRRAVLPSGLPIIYSDTVGFIRALPEELKAAFKATLEEVREATLLLHVLDASDAQISERAKAVRTILAEMGLEKVPVLNVLNKVDRSSAEIVTNLHSEFGGVCISALSGVGIAEMLAKIQEIIIDQQSTQSLQDPSEIVP